MLKRKLLGTAAIVAALAATPAFAQSTDTQTGPAALQLAELQQADADFAKDAAKGGLKEVRLGELASQKAVDADVKAFGQRMVEDHGKANDQLKSIAQQKGIELPAELDDEGKQAIDKLSALEGAEFDRAYVQDMVADHEKDVAKFQQQAENGQDPDLKAFAAQTLPTLQDHLDHIHGISTKVAAAAGTDMNATAAADAGAAATNQALAANNEAANTQVRVIGEMTADDLIGQRVVNADGQDIGEIDDLVLDQNKVAHVVVGVGGFLGIGEKNVALPVDRLQLSGDNDAILLSGMTEDDLRNLPDFERTAYVDYPREQRLAADNAATGTATGDLTEISPAAGTTAADGTVDQTQVAADQTQAAAAGQNLKVIGDMTVEQLLGQRVVNADGRDLGEIEDLVLDNNRLAHVVIGVGGFLGMGEKDVAIPVERLQLGDDQSTIMSQVTEDELRQLPSFEPRLSYAQYPRYSERTRVAGGQGTATVPSATDTGTTNTGAAVADNATAPAAQPTERITVIGDMTAADLIGQNLVNADGRDVGEIEDLVLDNNKVGHVVVGVGGFLGMGEKTVAIPVDRLQLGKDQAIVLSAMTEDDLRNLPEFDRNVYAQYPRSNAQVAADQGTAANQGATTGQDQVTAATRANPLGELTADDLIGKDVVNAQGEDVGEIKDIVIDAKNDKAVYAVLSVGGFLGMGDKDIVVPFSELATGENEAVLMNSATVDQLKGYPEWQEGATWTQLPRGKRIVE